MLSEVRIKSTYQAKQKELHLWARWLYNLRSRSDQVSKIRERSLLSLLSEGANDITGSMSGKVNIIFESFSLTQSPLSKKLSGIWSCPTGRRTQNALEQYICLLYQTGTIIIA